MAVLCTGLILLLANRGRGSVREAAEAERNGADPEYCIVSASEAYACFRDGLLYIWKLCFRSI